MVPVLDLNSSQDKKTGLIADACTHWGLFHVANHGIEPGLIESLQACSQNFFSLAVPAKQAVSRTMDNPFGYYDRELTKNLRDRKEIFDYAPNQLTPWPDSPAGFRTALELYALACHHLAAQLVSLCCQALGAEQDTLTQHFQSGHTSFLRLNHYPCSDHLAATEAPPTGPYGISQHSDAGAITVLLQDTVSGLQVLKDDKWQDVHPLADTLTINIGDMLQVWSNDRFRAPLHRVRASEGHARYSAAYFLNPDNQTVVAPLTETVSSSTPARYRAIAWAEFRRLRAMGDYGDYGEEVQISQFRA